MEHSGDTFSVTVQYQLAEHKQMVLDYLPLHLSARNRPPNPYLPWNWPILERAILAVFIPIMFKIKTAKVGICRFTFSKVGLTRKSKVGVASYGWDQVSEITRLSEVYLVHLESGGAMPIPYRAFTADQRTMFESFSGVL
jgi:hypothetical protein